MNYKFNKSPNKTNHLVIYFSGMGKTVCFEWVETVKRLNLDADVIFFIDNKDIFYTQGIEGYSKNENETINRILEYGKYNRYDFVGTSMGGYAAIRHAYKLSKLVDLSISINILVFNPYINPRDSSVSYKFTDDISLANYEGNNDFNHKKIYIVGKAINDQKQLNYLNKNNWIVKEYDTNSHTIALFLKEKKILDDIMKDFFLFLY